MFKKSLFVTTLIIGAVACQVVEGPDSVKQQTIHFSADSFTVFEDGCPETKTGIGEENKFYWSIGDTVGVYPNSGSQVYFVMDSEEEAHSADFDGGGWAFKVGSTYRSYYPFVGDIYLNAKKIPVRYYCVDKEGLIVLQKQVGNNSTSHIGPYDFMYTPETPAESDNLSLHYSHLSTILKPRLTLPAGHYIKLTMSLDEPLFVVRGEYDLTSDSPTIVGKELKREVSMDLDITLSEPGLLEAYYVTAAPIDMQGETLSVTVKDENGREYSYIYSPSRAYSAGEIVRLTSPTSFVIESVSLDNTDITLNKDETIVLTATVLPENAADKSVTWTSSDPYVASVSSNGEVSAHKQGYTTITVSTSNGLSASCYVMVEYDYPQPEAVDLGLSVKWASFNLGASSPEDYGAYFAWGETEPKISYSPDNYKWKQGSSYSDGFTKYCSGSYGYGGFADNISVLENSDDAARIHLGEQWRMPTKEELQELSSFASDPSKCSVESTTVNGVGGLRMTSRANGNSIFIPFSGFRSGYTWSGPDSSNGSRLWSTSVSSNSAFAPILYLNISNSVPQVTFIDNGASYSGYHRILGQTIRPVYNIVHVTGVSLNKTELSLSVGSSATLSATVKPESASDKTVTWSSSNTSVATVSNGTVTAKGVGSATITATAGGKSADCTVTVTPILVSGITLNRTTASINVGATTTLTATIAPTNAADKAVTWSSSNTDVATVSSSGVVTGVKAGTATITATAHDGSGIKATCSVTVSNVAVTSVTLDKTSLSLVNGNSETLTATVNPSNATDKTVTWSSSNTSVATVTNGTVTAKGVGTATITATAGGKSATCAVTVTVPVTGVSLNKTSLSLTKGSTETLTATITPKDATNKNVTWSSSKTSVATVDSNGMVTAVSSGSAIITVTTADGSFSASCQVTVSNPVTRIALYSKNLGKEVTSLSMLPDDSDELSIVFYPSDASDINEYKNLTNQYWQSSNSCVTCTFGAISADESLGNNSSIVSVYVKGLSASCSVKLLNSSTDAVDLGLSVKWMNRNVYTSSSSEFGPYYEWNEAKDRFNGDWRLPTKEEAEELVNNCTFTRSGNGYIVTSKNNGNTIFLPLAGGIVEGTYYSHDKGKASIYFTSTAATSSTYQEDMCYRIQFYFDEQPSVVANYKNKWSVRLVTSN